MLTYCVKRKRNTRNIDVKMIKTKNGSLNLFMKEQEAERLLFNLGIKTPMTKIP